MLQGICELIHFPMAEKVLLSQYFDKDEYANN